MKYNKFIISNYRAITGPMEINLSKNSLIPIIGVNECGKTTILHALFAFDYNNDNLNNTGRHLQDTTNLYSVNQNPPPPTIAADIELTFDEYRRILKDVDVDIIAAKAAAPTAPDMQLAETAYRRQRNKFPGKIRVIRDLKDKSYSIDGESYSDKNLNAKIAQKIISKLPYLLYFDDFRDSVENRVEIIEGKNKSGWLDIFQTLFESTDSSFSVYQLQNIEERQRKAVLSKVNKKLNQALTREWQNFRLDETDALRISIDYEEELAPTRRAFLKLDVIETDTSGDQHFFFVRDRSKGFFWFFNFVMKLEFNPKVVSGSDADAINLLDEPGSYLHAAAQEKLAVKLRQLSARNKVIYCTHSHHLLSPEVIPINTIRIAEKDGNGNVKLIPFTEHQGRFERRSAYQPLIDALQIRPLSLDFSNKPTIIVEGIFDYYLLEIFKNRREIAIFASVGASSIEYHISLMIAWRVPYYALWDFDDAGRASLETARAHFGDTEAQARFRMLEAGKARNRIMQNLIEGADMALLKNSLNLAPNASFEKTIAAWFYSQDKVKILRSISAQTKSNFDRLFDSLPFNGEMPKH